jgi:hypothetical protein
LNLGRYGVSDGHLSHWFNWSFGNSGKTELTMVKTWARFIVLKKIDDLPPEPDYTKGGAISYQGEPLRSEFKGRQSELFAVPLETEFPYEEMEIQHRSKAVILYAYGYADYFDVFGRSHQLRFGIRYYSEHEFSHVYDQFVIEGPPSYNQSH